MRTSIERLAWWIWDGRAGWVSTLAGLPLLPLSAVWRLAARGRNRRYDRRGGKRIDGLTVVSVGNLVVGGTGKTPVSSWVARTLVELGYRPTMLLREHDGDEGALHRRWTPTVPVLTGADRVRTAQVARSAGSDAVILDDGFQHRALARDLDIVLIAVDDALPGPVLPRGPYREPVAGLRRAQVVVITRRTTPAAVSRGLAARLRNRGLLGDGCVVGGVRLAPADLVPLTAYGRGGGETLRAAVSWLDGSVALTAIARPHAFREDVEALSSAPVRLAAFGDHHVFTVDDARRARQRAGSRPIVMTEKDAVKLIGHVSVLGEAWVLRQRLAWDWGERDVAARLSGLGVGRERTLRRVRNA